MVAVEDERWLAGAVWYDRLSVWAWIKQSNKFMTLTGRDVVTELPRVRRWYRKGDADRRSTNKGQQKEAVNLGGRPELFRTLPALSVHHLRILSMSALGTPVQDDLQPQPQDHQLQVQQQQLADNLQPGQLHNGDAQAQVSESGRKRESPFASVPSVHDLYLSPDNSQSPFSPEGLRRLSRGKDAVL